MNINNKKEKKTRRKFPSPAGVNYYEYDEIFYNDEDFFSFRPQQGLTIMNQKK